MSAYHAVFGSEALLQLVAARSNVAYDVMVFVGSAMFQRHGTTEALRWRCHIFDSLRKAMRIALPGGDNGLNDDDTARAMSPIRQGVMEFRRRIEEDPELTATHSFAKIAKQIDKYGDKLLTQMGQTPFAPELQSQADTGHILPGFRKIIILPTLPEHVVRLAAATQQMARSN